MGAFFESCIEYWYGTAYVVGLFLYGATKAEDSTPEEFHTNIKDSLYFFEKGITGGLRLVRLIMVIWVLSLMLMAMGVVSNAYGGRIFGIFGEDPGMNRFESTVLGIALGGAFLGGIAAASYLVWYPVKTCREWVSNEIYKLKK
jgi:hypothetical protein